MRERERFYAEAGTVPVWIIDGDALREVLPRQGFQDILWRQHAYILALDSGCLAAVAPGQPAVVRLVTLQETPRGLRYASEEMNLIDALAIVAPAGEITRPLLGVDPVSRRVFAALRAGDRAGLQAGIDSLCRATGLSLTASQAETDGLPAAIAALGTLLTGRKCDASRFGEEDVAAILNNFLSTARHRVWAPLVAQAGRLSEDADRHLQRTSTARKLNAALTALAEDPPGTDPALIWQPVLSRLFPRLEDGLVPQAEPAPAG